jgi:hypothetical protein
MLETTSDHGPSKYSIHYLAIIAKEYRNISQTMGDPLSVAASVVGITTAALQSIQYLVNTIDKIQGAPTAVKNINTDLKPSNLCWKVLIQGCNLEMVPHQTSATPRSGPQWGTVKMLVQLSASSL